MTNQKIRIKKLEKLIVSTHKNEKKLTKEERKTLILEYQEKISSLGIRLHEFVQRNQNGIHINYKIHHLLHDPFTFVNAYAKISKNKGAMTEGYDDEGIMKFFGLNDATKIATKIKQDKYKFKPVKRTWIPKPGKKKKRPIDVPTQSDRIVQEALRGILEAIFEPEFKHWGHVTRNLSNNYGFRPSMGPWKSLDILKKYSKPCTMVIEGDIVSAYNNVNHDILLSILRKRIKDKKFLGFIKQLLKSGIMDEKKYEHSLIGTPQGGIVSPLLFNIYLFGLDKFVFNEIILPLQKGELGKKGDDATPAYRQIRYRTNVALKRLRENKNQYKTNPTIENKEIYKTSLKEFKKLRNIRNSTQYGNIQRLKRKACYVRYADDWVLAITCNYTEAEQIKKRIAEYLETERNMQLDDEKTKITRVSKGYKFLGFEIRMLTDNVRQILKTQKSPSGKYSRVLKRTTSRMLTIEPDSDRILNRMKRDQFCDSKYEPIAKPGWLIYDDYDIVEKYGQIFRGLYNYYLPCERLTRLNRISYILQYSCARTLARRRKISKRKVFRKYGKNLTITKTIQSTKNENILRTAKFLTLTDLRRLNTKIQFNQEPIDPFRIRQYWRTKIKLYNECCLCGETEQIAMHHLNAVQNLEKTKKKNQHQVIRSTINRMQIPVCVKCNNDIKNGKYNDPKKPIEFYNEFLAKL